ncbi:F-box/kelch-repeat protein At3g23880-like [Apium graveolens]|uniref:F-box/kelch-repeat protein At3g23880-like n=1 Tax=Apium graveolens TaxID=4045 RepID=UPI003D79FE1F
MDLLPEDVLTQILVKVPCSKSILRCTSVCKPWYSLIKSPVFIKLHLSCPNNTKYLFCDFKSPGTKSRYLSIHHDTESFDEHYRLLFPGDLRHGMFILACCNGLICYTKSHSGLIHLWNPTIRKLKVLPRYRNHGGSCFGFWFDRQVNDYFVAKISTEQASSVDVYSLRTNSWRTITKSVPARSVAAGRDLVYVNGKLHWPRKASSERWMICSLDIESGRLGETDIVSNKKVSDIYLTPIGECSFAVYGSKYVNDLLRCCMVQVYDQNVNKLYTIDLENHTLYDLQRVVGLRNNGEALFPRLDLDHLEIISCNAKTKDFRRFTGRLKPHLRTASEEVDGYPYNSRQLHHVRPFIETLALLNDEDAEDTSAPNYQLTSKRNCSSYVWLSFLRLFVLLNTIFLLYSFY